MTVIPFRTTYWIFILAIYSRNTYIGTPVCPLWYLLGLASLSDSSQFVLCSFPVAPAPQVLHKLVFLFLSMENRLIWEQVVIECLGLSGRCKFLCTLTQRAASLRGWSSILVYGLIRLKNDDRSSVWVGTMRRAPNVPFTQWRMSIDLGGTMDASHWANSV